VHVTVNLAPAARATARASKADSLMIAAELARRTSGADALYQRP
jgi:hypothetical protein